MDQVDLVDQEDPVAQDCLVVLEVQVVLDLVISFLDQLDQDHKMAMGRQMEWVLTLRKYSVEPEVA